MGIWVSLSIFESYSNILRFGIVNGMNRELPFAQGSGNHALALKYANTTFSFTMINIALLIIVFVGIQFFVDFELMKRAALSVIGIKICISFYTAYLAGTFRSDDQFNKLSNIQFYLLLVRLLLCPLVLLGFYGYLLYITIDAFVGMLLHHYYRPFKGHFQIDLPALRGLFSTGFPIFLVSYIISAVETLPRLFVVYIGSASLLGIYAPVLMLINTVSLLPNILANYLYPKLSFNLGKNNNPVQIWKSFLKMNFFSFLFLLTFSITAYFFVSYFKVIFPKYSQSEPYLKLSLLICPFVFFKLGYMLNVIFKNQKNMIAYSVVYLLLQVLTLLLFYQIETDVLRLIIYSQLITWTLLMLFAYFISKRMIDKMIIKVNE
jgi:O-antigen/teichoic acid export membrane protein